MTAWSHPWASQNTALPPLRCSVWLLPSATACVRMFLHSVVSSVNKMHSQLRSVEDLAIWEHSLGLFFKWCFGSLSICTLEFCFFTFCSVWLYSLHCFHIIASFCRAGQVFPVQIWPFTLSALMYKSSLETEKSKSWLFLTLFFFFFFLLLRKEFFSYPLYCVLWFFRPLLFNFKSKHCSFGDS